MIRHDLFAFLSCLVPNRPPADEEMTSPVKTSLDNLAVASNGFSLLGADLTVHLALDWWVHVGGSIREQLEAMLEREIQGARSIEIELLMRPDPVVAFEVNAWIERRLKALTARRALTSPIEVRVLIKSSERFGWVSSAPLIGAFPIVASVTDWVDLEETVKLLGLSHLYPPSTYIDFATAMQDEVGVDLCEPPWMFWSRLPVWLKHRNRDLDVSEFESRISFFRAILSPQDEEAEAASLADGSVMMNPTFEAVERSRFDSGSREAPLLARVRTGATLTSRTISSLEALILDHVRESFRTKRSDLSVEVERGSGVRKEFVDRAVSSLVRDGFLLGR